MGLGRGLAWRRGRTDGVEPEGDGRRPHGCTASRGISSSLEHDVPLPKSILAAKLFG